MEMFRRNVRVLREDIGISQSELARRVERSPGYVCDIEHGRRRPNLTTVAVLAEALGVNPFLLLSRSLATGKISPPSADK